MFVSVKNLTASIEQNIQFYIEGWQARNSTAQKSLKSGMNI